MGMGRLSKYNRLSDKDRDLMIKIYFEDKITFKLISQRFQCSERIIGNVVRDHLKKLGKTRKELRDESQN